MFGISEFSAVINPPQAVIMAVGEGRKVIAASPTSVDPDGTASLSVSISAPHIHRHFFSSPLAEIDVDEHVPDVQPKVVTVASVTLSCDNRYANDALMMMMMGLCLGV